METTEQIRPDSNKMGFQDVVDARKFPANIKARHIIVNRPSSNFGGSAINMQATKKQMYQSYDMQMVSNQAMSNTWAAGDFKKDWRVEQTILQDLNARLASYIEKAQPYEAQNKILNEELIKLKTLWGSETLEVKAMYQADLDEARRLLDDAIKEKSMTQITVTMEIEKNEELQQSLKEVQAEAAEAKEQLEQQNQKVFDLEAEIGLLRRRLTSIETAKEKETARNKKLHLYLSETRQILKTETIKYIEAEARRQTLEEELTLFKSVHERQMREFRSLIKVDSMARNQEFWRAEMEKAIRDIQVRHNESLEEMRLELEMSYNQRVEKKIQECEVKMNVQWTYVKEENDKLREELRVVSEKFTDADSKYVKVTREFEMLAIEKGKLEEKLMSWIAQRQNEIVTLQASQKTMHKQIKSIDDSKTGFGLELITYQRLLDLEENRRGSQLTINAIDSGSSKGEGIISKAEETSGDHSSTVKQTMKHEISSTSQKSAKGPVTISDCSQDGKYVALKNTGRKEQMLGRWSLTRIIDSVAYATYMFDEGFVIRPGETIKVWSQGTKPIAGEVGDIESSLDWGTGKHVTTKLINPVGEERANYILETSSGENIVQVVNGAN